MRGALVTAPHAAGSAALPPPWRVQKHQKPEKQSEMPAAEGPVGALRGMEWLSGSGSGLVPWAAPPQLSVARELLQRLLQAKPGWV